MRRRVFVLTATLATGLLLAGAPQAYVLSGHYWGASSVNYFVNPANRDMSQQAAIASLQAAATNGWKAYPMRWRAGPGTTAATRK